MDNESENALEFEFGIVGEDFELSDDESMFSKVAVHALKAEMILQEGNITRWREDDIVRLQKFFDDLLEELQPSSNDYFARMDIVSRLRSALEQMDSFRGTVLSTFGSFESNLFTRWADLDLSLELPDRNDLLQPVGKNLKVRMLNAVSRTLIRRGEACKVQFIPYARVPLVTFEDSKHSIACDVSVNNDSAFVKSRTLRWLCEIDSRCRDLIFLVKFWAKAHDINSPKQGTLNSFALCLLVIFHLQTRSPPVLPPLCAILDGVIGKRLSGLECSKEDLLEGYWEKIRPFIDSKFGAQNKSSVAELFVTFINQFCAVKELWSHGLAVCTFTGAWGDPSSTCEIWRSKTYMIAIEDPFDRVENCARSVHCKSFYLIVEAFTSTAEALSCPLANWGLPLLLESLYLWPSDKQALGLQYWLTKVLIKDKKHQCGEVNADAVQVFPSFSRRQAPYKFLPKHEAQLYKELQFKNLCPPVQIKNKLTRVKVSRPTAIVNAGSGLSSSVFDSREHNDLTRKDTKGSKVTRTMKHAFTRETVSCLGVPGLVATKDGSFSEVYREFDRSSVRKDDSRDVLYNFVPNHPFESESHTQLQCQNSGPVQKKKRSTRKVSHGSRAATVVPSMEMSHPESGSREKNIHDLGRIEKMTNNIAATRKPGIIKKTMTPCWVVAKDGSPLEGSCESDHLSVRKDANRSAEKSLPRMEGHSLVEEARQSSATCDDFHKLSMYPSNPHVEDRPIIERYRNGHVVKPTETLASTIPQRGSPFVAQKCDSLSVRGSFCRKGWSALNHSNRVWKPNITGYTEGAREHSAVSRTNCIDRRRHEL